jgi:hypothetical protein
VSHIRRATVFLTMLNLALGMLVFWIWTTGQQRVQEPTTSPANPLSLPDLGALNSTPMHSVDVATIRDQAVFYVARAFYQPPPASTEIPAPDYELAGTMRLSDGKRLAFVKRRSDHVNRTMHVGDDLDGWKVRLVESERVLLERGEQVAELTDNKPAYGTGLIRQPASPKIAQTGLRILGGTGPQAARITTSSAVRESRTFHPPPQAGK